MLMFKKKYLNLISRKMRTFVRYIIIGLICIVVFGIYYYHSPSCASSYEWVGPKRFVTNGKNHKFFYDRIMPLIFIGGMPRSGTTLLRVLLDAHPDVRCGEETRLIPKLLEFRQSWLKAPFETLRLREAGITLEVFDSAIGAFILEIIAKHGTPAPRLCNNDPLTMLMPDYLHNLFPNSKFIFMIRDGRAVVHSIITRKITIAGFDRHSFKQCLKEWNAIMSSMNSKCHQLGNSVCLPVYYEQLVLHPKQSMETILRFLEIPWNDSVLNHEELVDKYDGIILSKLEQSTEQVIKPINIEALFKWVGKIPADVIRDMHNIAPMLSALGYDPFANPPDYGKPDSFVLHKMEQIQRDKHNWGDKERELKRLRASIRHRLIKHKHKSNNVETDNAAHDNAHQSSDSD